MRKFGLMNWCLAAVGQMGGHHECLVVNKFVFSPSIDAIGHISFFLLLVLPRIFMYQTMQPNLELNRDLQGFTMTDMHIVTVV